MEAFLQPLEDRRLFAATIGAGHHIWAEATDSFTGRVGNLPGSTASKLAELHGSINWGDGTAPSDATFNRAADGSIRVAGTHTFAAKGEYKIDVLITRRPVVKPGQPNPFFAISLGDLKTKATVKPDVDGGVSLIETATQQFTAKVGSYDLRPLDLIATASIDWGDGTKSAGEIKAHTKNAFDGEWDVIGTHTYSTMGEFKVHVTINTHMAGAPQISGKLTDFFSSIRVMGWA